MKKKILILGVSSVQLDAIVELKKMGYEIYACAMAKDGPGADAADHFEEINILDKDSLIKYIINNNVSLVYSVGSDLAIPIASSISEQLNMPHFVSEKTARLCNNKNLMRTALSNEFEGNIKFQVISDINNAIELNYPFIMKPSDSQGQRGVALINNYNEFLKCYEISKSFSRSKLVLIEQYIQGRELSVNGFLIDGELRYLIASDRITWPGYIGLIHQHIVPARGLSSEAKEKLKRIIISACKKLNISNGPVYAQMKMENGVPYIIEVTPRLDGCHLWKILSLYTGINLLKLTFEFLLNNDTSELNNRFKKFKGEYVMEFICQEPNTKADYSRYHRKIENSLTYFNYYEQGDPIKPVNGKFEKIGYFIYKT